MALRVPLRIGGVRVLIDGDAILMPPWLSSHKHGGEANPNAPNYHTSTIENGRVYGRDRRGIGQRGSILPDCSRATMYRDTGYANAAVSITWEGRGPFPSFPTMCVTPNVGFEHDLSAYYEPFAGPDSLTPVVWNVGQHAWLEGMRAISNAGNVEHVAGTQRVIRAEVIGQRMCSYIDGVFAMETHVPFHMAGSTFHGISMDTHNKTRHGYDGTEIPSEANPYYPPYGVDFTYYDEETEEMYVGRSATEESIVIEPITHFLHEPAGELGPELINDPDFRLGGVWNLGSLWTADYTYNGEDPVSITGITVARLLPNDSTTITSGYAWQALDEALEQGETYRLTLCNSTQISDNGRRDVPYTSGIGRVRIEFYSESPPIAMATHVIENTSSSGQTVDFVADEAYTHVRIYAISRLNAGVQKLLQTVVFASCRKFTAEV